MKNELPQRCWCEVDLKSIDRNLAAIRRRIGRKTSILALVKADAYGHGMIPVARHLETADCQLLGCAHVREGIALRKAGIRKPILLLSGFLKEELPAIIKNKLMVTLSTAEEARMASKAAQKAGRPLSLHVKIDTGMGRLGSDPALAPALLSLASRLPGLRIAGVFSHYSSADEDTALTRRQWELFHSIPLPKDLPRHMCNSAGLLRLPDSHDAIVRPGVALYGISPLPSAQKDFTPALAWKSRVVLVRKIPKGTTISYGATFTAPGQMKIATVAVGYGDGLFRSLSNKGTVLIRGRRCRILGRVTMDQIVVDLGTGTASKGDEVVLIGKQGKETLTANDMARDAGTIPYEIWCHITDRVPRMYP